MRDTPVVAAPSIRVATGSHVGQVRTNNEDRVYADPERGGFAVIDGVGGQAAGEVAAEAALDTIHQRLQLQIGTPAERVREAIALANDQIYQQAQVHPDRHGMACVLTLVLLHNGTLTAGHVGDTRLYKVRGGLLRKLTHDHSPIGEREDRGELTESEAMRHPRRNEVYREVGAEPHHPDEEGFIEVIEEPFEADAALLLCSDGLTDVLSSAAIAGIIERHAGEPTHVVDRLIDRANEAGGKDNISVVYIEGAAFGRGVNRSATVLAFDGVSTPTVTRAAGAAGAIAASTDERDATGMRASGRNGVAAAPARTTDVASTGTRRSDTGAATSATTATPAGAAAGAGAGGGTGAGAVDGEIDGPSSFGVGQGAAQAGSGHSTASGTDARGRSRDASRSAQSTRSGQSAQSAHAVRPAAGTVHATAANRVVWFVAGLLFGVAIALGVAYAMRDVLIPRMQPLTPGPRTLVVDPSAPAPAAAAASVVPPTTFRTIGQALAAARAGDTIHVSAGEYREQIVVPDGVHLIARSPRNAVLRAPAEALQPFTAIIVSGTRHESRVSGFKIAGDAQAPITIGVHVFGRASLDDLEVSGTTLAGIELAGGTLSVTSSALHDNAGAGVALKGGDARLAHNVLLRNGGAMTPQPGADIVATASPQVTLLGNVFGADPVQRVRGLAADQIARVKETNIVLPPPASAPAARPRAGGARRPPR